jgi:ribonuclease Z
MKTAKIPAISNVRSRVNQARRRAPSEGCRFVKGAAAFWLDFFALVELLALVVELRAGDDLVFLFEVVCFDLDLVDVLDFPDVVFLLVLLADLLEDDFSAITICEDYSTNRLRIFRVQLGRYPQSLVHSPHPVKLGYNTTHTNDKKVLALFEFVFLGTSASAPSIHRGLSAHVVIHDEHRFLIDCGEGTQRQIMLSGIGFKRLNRILITHGHLDHILGLAGLLSTFMRWESIDNLEIFAGRWALERIDDLLNGVVLRGARPPITIRYIEVKAGQIIEEDDFTVSAFPVYHRGQDSFGYLFEEKAHRPFLPDLAEALGIPAGPWRRDLVNGISVTLPDGRRIEPHQVLGEARPGTRLVHVGDVGRTQELIDVCQGTDALVIEATYLQEEVEMAREFAHMTANQAAQLAVDAGVKNLILTHISRRYRERDVLAEARSVFPQAIIARDFDAFQIKRGSFAKISQVGQES